VTKHNPENCKNCSSKSAYDCAENLAGQFHQMPAGRHNPWAACIST